MVSIVLGVGALGAALVGGGGAGFYFWKKTEPNLYDAALSINYKAVYNRELSPADQADALYWKQCTEAFLDDNRSTNVVVIGDYKQGKTTVLNGLSGMLLETNYTSSMEGIKFKKTSWTASDKQELEVLLIDTEGLNHLPGDATNRDLMARRQGYDQFIQEVAVRLGDVSILVTDKPSMAFTQRLTEICNLVARTKNTRTLVVVYNLYNVEKKDDLSQFFEREVAVRFNCSKFENSMPSVSYHYSTETIAGANFKIVHLPLAKEGSEAAKHFHKNTYDTLRYLVELEAARKGDAGDRRLPLREQVAALAPLFKRVLGITLPKDDQSVPYVPIAKQ